MARMKYVVHLSDEERKEVQHLARAGKGSSRKATRARTLLKADAGWQERQIAEALDIHRATVASTRKRFVKEGLEGALNDRPRPGQPRKLDEKGEAHLIALACSTAPEGHDHWTLRLLADKAVELGMVTSFSHEGVRKRLKKTTSSPGKRRSGVFQR